MTITVRDLTMTYRAPVRAEGLRAAIGSLVRREEREIQAVRGISFDVDAGEIVGFIGPNGAGKTSTLKMLSGILHPTGGDVRVLGFTPSRREPAFLRQIAMIRGSQPLAGPPELTVMDAMRLQKLIYDVPDDAFRRNVAQLSDMLSLAPVLDRQLRALSLGERVRCGLALALLYRPKVLFLDEPTIGMDVSVVEMTRRFIRDYCAETNATVLLTSHFMADVERLCRRIVLIDHGDIVYDGDLGALAARISPYRLVSLAVDERNAVDWTRFGEVVTTDPGRIALRVHQRDVPAVARAILAEHAVIDLAITEPSLERVIDQVYREGMACAG
jgi:ABC-2 type transport system ATP-binding protein